MFDIRGLLEKYWGSLRFYAAMGERPFAEIIIEDKLITIRIINVKVLMEAMVSHVFRKHRFGSFKLKTLKDAGYRVRIQYRRLSFEV
jgi:hypothetical protein